MNVIQQAHELLPRGQKVCAAIGMFDGVHRGHQLVLAQTIADARALEARAVAITFDQHPNAVVAPDRTPPLIYSLPQRLRVIDSLGIDTVYLIHFDRAFSLQSGEQFVRASSRELGLIQSICIGRDFVFGNKRSGDVKLLRELGAQLGFVVRELGPVGWRGEVISSTRIREVIQGGELEAAGEMLGRPYAVAGKVLRGDQLGQKLGFPTANLDISGLVLPPAGVYAGRALACGRAQRAVANIGRRPTLNRPEPDLRLEAHLLDFDGDLYGQEVEFEFVRRLRGEEKFASLEALRRQIEKDIEAARELLD